MIDLSDSLVWRCQAWGRQMVDRYASGSRSLRYSSHGAERNPVLHATSKIAECVFALDMGLDPGSALDWGGSPDHGYDVVVGRTCVDVKQSGMNSRYLIWPTKKNGMFDSKSFHVLVLVKTDIERERDGERRIMAARGYCAGWIGKRSFALRHQVAGADHKLDQGTRYMPQSRLHRMDVFPGRGLVFCFCGEAACEHRVAAPPCVCCRGTGTLKGAAGELRDGRWIAVPVVEPCPTCGDHHGTEVVHWDYRQKG
jgi:hypothetical protein